MNQLKRLGCKEFVICFDGDEAGRRGTEKLRRQLSSSAIVWSIKMFEGKDVNDCTPEEFRQLYADKE